MRKNNILLKHYLESTTNKKVTELKKEEELTPNVLPSETKNETDSNILAPIEGFEIDPNTQASLLESESPVTEGYVSVLPKNLQNNEVIKELNNTIDHSKNFIAVISSLLEKYGQTDLNLTTPKIKETGDIIFLSMFRKYEEIKSTFNYILETHESLSLNFKKIIHKLNDINVEDMLFQQFPNELILGFNGFSIVKLLTSDSKTRVYFNSKILPEFTSNFTIDTDGYIHYDTSNGDFTSYDLMGSVSTLSSFLISEGKGLIIKVEEIIKNYKEVIEKCSSMDSFSANQIEKLVNEILDIFIGTINYINIFIPEIVKILCNDPKLNLDHKEYLKLLTK